MTRYWIFSNESTTLSDMKLSTRTKQGGLMHSLYFRAEVNTEDTSDRL